MFENLSSTETKKLFGISDCELMHRREAGLIDFIKQGNAYKYSPSNYQFLKQHPLAKKVLNWHHDKHNIQIENFPFQYESINAIASLIKELLLPIENKFGPIIITYGFVCPELNTYIQKHSSSGTYPSIDQHAACEHNKNANPISSRSGAACDFVVKGYEKKMDVITKYIVDQLPFDKIYFYGKDRPLHISSSEEPLHHLQIMNTSQNGRRIPGKKAFGDKAKQLAMELDK